MKRNKLPLSVTLCTAHKSLRNIWKKGSSPSFFFCGQNNGIFWVKEKWNYLLLYTLEKGYSLWFRWKFVTLWIYICSVPPVRNSHRTHIVNMFLLSSLIINRKPFLFSHAKSRDGAKYVGVFSGNYTTCCRVKRGKKDSIWKQVKMSPNKIQNLWRNLWSPPLKIILWLHIFYGFCNVYFILFSHVHYFVECFYDLSKGDKGQNLYSLYINFYLENTFYNFS